MTNNQSGAWSDATREGFEELGAFRSTVIDAEWVEPKNQSAEFAPTKQLQLVHQVEFIEDPPDAAVPEKYITWYSVGSKGDYTIEDDGRTLYSPSAAANNEKVQIIRSSKYGKLIDRSVEQQSPVIERGWVTDAHIWIGMRADWRLETVSYGGRLKDSTVTLPSQVLGFTAVSQPGQPIPSVNGASAPPSATASAPTPAAPMAPSMAAAPMAPAPPTMAAAPVASQATWTVAAAVVNDLKEHGWLDYVTGVLNNGLWPDAVKILRADGNCMGNSTLMNAVENNGLLDFMKSSGFFDVDAGNIMHGKVTA